MNTFYLVPKFLGSARFPEAVLRPALRAAEVQLRQHVIPKRLGTREKRLALLAKQGAETGLDKMPVGREGVV